MRTLLAAVLLLRAFPLFALAVQPEVPISPAERAPTQFARHTGVATNGEIYAAIWTDLRSYKETYVARLRPDGTLLDPVGIRVAPNSQAGAVIWTGNTFLIAYLDVEHGMVKVRTFSPDGTLGDPIDIFGNYVLAESYRMKMATNGDSVLLITSDATASLLELDGNERRQISFPWLFAQHGFGVATVGSTYLVAAGTHEGLLKTQIVTPEGDFGALHTEAEHVFNGVDVASDGERFFVAWSAGNVFARFMNRDGEWIGAKIQITHTNPITFYTHGVKQLVRRGGEYIVVYSTSGGGSWDTLRISNDGRPGAPFLTNFGGLIDHIVIDGQDGAVFGQKDSIFTAAFFVSDPSLVYGETRISVSGKPQTRVRLAHAPGGIIAAWATDSEIWISRGPGSAPVQVSGYGNQLIDVLVTTDTVWVIWIVNERYLYARRLTLDLQLVDPQPVFIETNPGFFAVGISAAAGAGFVAVVTHEPLDAFGAEPMSPHVFAYILRSTQSGIEVKEAAVASEVGFDHHPAISWNGGVFAIAWANATAPTNPSDTLPDDRILMVRMLTNGELLDDEPVEIARTTHIDAMHIANRVVAWETTDWHAGVTTRHTFAARAEEGATVVDLGGDGMDLGAFASDNDGFLLMRGRTIDGFTFETELLALDANLAVTSSIALPPMRGFFQGDVLGGPSPLIAYSRIAGEEYGHAFRVFVRRLAETLRRRALR